MKQKEGSSCALCIILRGSSDVDRDRAAHGTLGLQCGCESDATPAPMSPQDHIACRNPDLGCDSICCIQGNATPCPMRCPRFRGLSLLALSIEVKRQDDDEAA